MSGGKATPSGDMPRNPNASHLADGELEKILLAAQEDVTLLCAPDTTIHYVSPSVTFLMGYTPEDLVRKSFADFIHEDDLAALADEWQKFQDGGDDDPVQFRARRADGTWCWCEARAGYINDERLEGFASVTLREMEHHYRLRSQIAAAEVKAKMGSWRWIIEGGEPEWTASMYRLLGYEPVEGPVDLEWAHSLTHPDDRDRFRDHILDCLEDPKSFTLHTRKLAADGKYRSIIHHCHAEHDVNGNFVALMGICQDVTAQTAAENGLRKSEREYRLLAEEASDVILRVNTEGRCTFASAACMQILGYEPADVVGTVVLRYAQSSDHGTIRAVYEKAREGYEAQRITIRGRHKSGKTVWLEAGVRPMTDDDGTFTELVIIARDITERRLYEDELRQAREKAEQASLSKSQFLANMSHELRTPLNAVIGFSDLMREQTLGPLGSDQYTDYVGLIHESGLFLLDLINDILDVSKIEAGKYELFMEEVDLDHMIKRCFRIMETRASDGGVRLQWAAPSTMPRLHADERTLKQIMLNLLSNAVKFTGYGGSVSVNVTEDEGFLLVSVTDTGCGIPADAIPRLAQPFEQVESHTQLAQRGTGLGLALVKSFVELHGGELRIASVVDEGTTVSFTLPLHQGAQQAWG